MQVSSLHYIPQAPNFAETACTICLQNLSDTTQNGPVVGHLGDGEKHPLHKRCVQALFIKDHGYRECPSCHKPIDFYSLYPFPFNQLAGPMVSLVDRIASVFDPEAHFGPPGASTNLLVDVAPALQSRCVIISLISAAVFVTGIYYMFGDAGVGS